MYSDVAILHVSSPVPYSYVVTNQTISLPEIDQLKFYTVNRNENL